MPRRSESKRARLQAYLAEHKPALIDEALLVDLQQHLAPVSSSYLRELVRSSGLPLTPLVEGIRQDSLAEAERTLIALSTVYNESDNVKRKQIRSVVIQSKDRLRWSLKRAQVDPARRALKEEILLWMITWLENPPVFASWLSLRRRGEEAIESESRPP